MSLKRVPLLTVFLIACILRAPAVLASPCLADINADGRVDSEDLEIMQKELDRDNCFRVPCRADLNGDGKVNGMDGEILIAEFGREDCFFAPGDILGEETDMPQADEEAALDSAEGEGIKEETEEPPEVRFVDHGNGTVTDPGTGLMWTKNAKLKRHTLIFHQALDYIDGLNKGDFENFGYTDWRLPTIAELRSLIDYTIVTRKGHTVQPGHPFEDVQSFDANDTLSYISSSDFPLFVSLYCRFVGRNINSCHGYVWPVRGGQ